MTVEKSINFNGKEIIIKGTVIRREDDHYLVDFYHNHTEYRGWWPVAHCRYVF